MSRVDSDHCRACGSGNLHSGYYDAEDYAVDGRAPNPGTRWTTFCNECGHDQAKPKPRKRTA